MNSIIRSFGVACAVLTILSACLYFADRAPSGDKVKVVDVRPKKTAKWLKGKPNARWIWHKQTGERQQLFFRKSFTLPAKVKSARIYTTCDNKLKLWINGTKVGEGKDWMYPLEKMVTPLLKAGKNSIAAQCKNSGGPAGFVLKMVIEMDGEKKAVIVTDKSWRMAEKETAKWHTADFDDASWSNKNLRVAAKLGASPWGIPNYTSRQPVAQGNRLDPKNVTVPKGFEVDLIYTVPRSEGSWVSLTTDPRGGFYACDQGGRGLFHIDVDAKGKATVKRVPINLSGAQGLVWAFDALWFHRNGGNLYRVTDSDNDGELDKVEAMPSTRGGGEHGNHALVVTQDGKGLYLCSGNASPLAKVTRKRVQNWKEDFLNSRMWDARGHARGRMAPGGWITRFDPVTKEQELICSGFRNQYDIAYNRYGDLFTYDSDMEWDLGLPWYRPTRICLIASGADYGWRSGTGKWPEYYEDSLPPVVEIGPGSPTGMVSGKGTKFPAKYQDAVYALDWTFGTIYAIHITPKGAGYSGTSEPFAYGAPLPVTDAIVSDGAMYFLIGGRGTQSAMFRIRYVGKESTKPTEGDAYPEATKARQIRQQLETYHGRIDANAVTTAWPHLSSDDRFLRNAARVAIESQPVKRWANRVFDESDPQARITGAVALARMGDTSHRAKLASSLLELEPSKLSEMQFLGLLRAYALNFIRLGRPTVEERKRIIEKLDPHLPNKSNDLNTELLRVMTYLHAPNTIKKGMQLIANPQKPKIPNWSELASRNRGYGGTVQRMLDNHPPSYEIGYAFLLRNTKYGWTLKQRREYFTFLNAAAKKSGGASFPGYLTNIRNEALTACTNKERIALKDLTGENFNPVPKFKIVKPQGPGRKWKLADALKRAPGRPNFERGRSLFFSANCGKCHRVRGLGGSVGPDLTAIPTRFDERYVIEAIINPSKDISDQYGSSVVALKDGTVVNGLVVGQENHLEIYPPDVKAESIRVNRKDVLSMRRSSVSQMPTGLLDALNPEEVRDLVAYLMAGGNPRDRRFR